MQIIYFQIDNLQSISLPPCALMFVYIPKGHDIKAQLENYLLRKVMEDETLPHQNMGLV